MPALRRMRVPAPALCLPPLTLLHTRKHGCVKAACAQGHEMHHAKDLAECHEARMHAWTELDTARQSSTDYAQRRLRGTKNSCAYSSIAHSQVRAHHNRCMQGHEMHHAKDLAECHESRMRAWTELDRLRTVLAQDSSIQLKPHSQKRAHHHACMQGHEMHHAKDLAECHEARMRAWTELDRLRSVEALVCGYPGHNAKLVRITNMRDSLQG